MFKRKKAKKAIEEETITVVEEQVSIETTEEKQAVGPEVEAPEEKLSLKEERKMSRRQKKGNKAKEREQKIDDMIKEVEIFSSDGEFEFKRGKAGWIFLILVILALTAGGYWYFNQDDSKPKEKKANDGPKTSVLAYDYKIEEGVISFYNGKDLINSYECVSKECEVYNKGAFSYFSDNPTVIALADDGVVFLYNYVDNKKLSDEYAVLQNLKKNDETVAFIAYDKEGKAGIINIKGKVVVPFEHTDMAYSYRNGEVTDYSYGKGFITAQNEEGWGLISIETGMVIIPFAYADIYFNGNDCVAVKEDEMWKLLDLQGKEILEDSYDIIIPIRSYIFAAKEDNFTILNYKGKQIVSNEIPTYIKGFRSRTMDEIPTFKIEINGSEVTIYIMKDKEKYNKYNFNTINGTLIEVLN